MKWNWDEYDVFTLTQVYFLTKGKEAAEIADELNKRGWAYDEWRGGWIPCTKWNELYGNEFGFIECP